MPTGRRAPFETAAEVWQRHRAGDIDAIDDYGVDPELPFKGADFVADYVARQAAHRYGDEVLLWDAWQGAQTIVNDPTLTDRLADLLTRADTDAEAERELATWYAADIAPGRTITQRSPYGDPAVEVELAAASGGSS